MLRSKLQCHYFFEQTIDERVTKFKGSHLTKQYMKQQTIQSGFQHWCCNNLKPGYLHQFDFYVGKKKVSPEFGLSESVSMELTGSLKNRYC